MKRSLSFLVLLFLSGSVSAYSAANFGVGLTVLECSTLRGSKPVLTIDATGRDQLQAAFLKGRLGGVSLDGIAPIAVTARQDRDMGAPLVYADKKTGGKDFELEVKVDAQPLPGGKTFSHLVAELDGRRVSEDLACAHAR